MPFAVRMRAVAGDGAALRAAFAGGTAIFLALGDGAGTERVFAFLCVCHANSPSSNCRMRGSKLGAAGFSRGDKTME